MKSPTHPAMSTGCLTAISKDGSPGRSPASAKWTMRMDQGSPKAIKGGTGLSGRGFESHIPMAMAMREAMYPQIGPKTPTSTKARRLGMRLRMRMIAPAVPLRVGAGRSRGRVVLILCARQAK